MRDENPDRFADQLLDATLAHYQSAEPRWGLEERIPLVSEFAARVLPLFQARADQGASLRPVLERSYPMTQLADAHRVMEGNATFGKIVVEW